MRSRADPTDAGPCRLTAARSDAGGGWPVTGGRRMPIGLTRTAGPVHLLNELASRSVVVPVADGGTLRLFAPHYGPFVPPVPGWL